MTARRLSTLSFARMLAPNLPDGAKMLRALERPQVREIIETLDGRAHGTFFILAAYQIVKSLLGQLHLARNHWIRPRKAGWYGPTDKFQTAFFRDKLGPLLEASDQIRALRILPAGKPPIAGTYRGEAAAFDRTKYTSDFVKLAGGGSHQLLSAQTEGDRTGRTLEDIYIDEGHLMLPGAIEQIRNRRGDSTETQAWIELIMTTGLNRGDNTLPGTEAAAIWDTTDQRLWHVRCPSCQQLSPDRFLIRAGEYDFKLIHEIDRASASGPCTSAAPPLRAHRSDGVDAPIIGGYYYDRAFLENGLPDPTRIEPTLRWVCPCCSVPAAGGKKYEPRCALPNTPASRELLSGTYEKPRGRYIPQNPHPHRATYGWNFTALTVRDWMRAIMRFETAQLARARGDLEPLALTIREEFGGIWHPAEYIKESRTRPPGGYKMADIPTWGTIPALPPTSPAHESLRTWWPSAGFDSAGIPYLIATVDVQQDWFRLIVRAWNRQSQSRLLLADTITTAGRLAEICDLLGVARSRTALDSRHKPQEVRHWCARYGWRALIGEGATALKGQKDYAHPDGIRRVISEIEWLDPFLGTALQGQSRVGQARFAKWSCLDRLNLLRQLRAQDDTPLFTAADDGPAWYFRELDAYHRIPKWEHNVETHEYQVHGPDHSADAEIMQIAIASALNLTGAESLPEPAPPNTPVSRDGA